jgi:hypothetical protein
MPDDTSCGGSDEDIMCSLQPVAKETPLAYPYDLVRLRSIVLHSKPELPPPSPVPRRVMTYGEAGETLEFYQSSKPHSLETCWVHI